MAPGRGNALTVTWPLGGFTGLTAVLPVVVVAPFVLLRDRPLTVAGARV